VVLTPMLLKVRLASWPASMMRLKPSTTPMPSQKVKPAITVKLPYRITALASFTSYAVSFTLGFPLITAATIRYWIYSRSGTGS
jgi:hypothetical protein